MESRSGALSRRQAKPAALVVETQLKSSRVDKFHGQVLTVLRKHADIDASGLIGGKPPLPEEWERVNGETIKLVLRSRHSRDLAKLKSGNILQVFRVKSFENLWLSWYERLKRVGDKLYSVDGVSANLWVGGEGQVAKASILRIEWDHSEAAGTVPADEHHAAQPHWQIDHAAGMVLTTNEGPAIADVEAAGLAELPPIGLVEQNGEPPQPAGFQISRYHLGMRAEWIAAERRGWQQSLAHNLDSVPNWLDLCLEYLTREITKHGIDEYS